MKPPAFFDRIRAGASRRWEQLDADPDLAAPWHQLFKQVQSPSHVLSELLQNADDASATSAYARIEDEIFTFEHNGEDFTEEHFASLCRFGYSNKRILHTIGFRGIGFKCIFSLGDCVELATPTLSLFFDSRRFTEPQWAELDHPPDNLTRVRVAIRNKHCKAQLEKNLKHWTENPVSLLFFNHIRRVQIADHAIHWDNLGPGPVPGTEWVALSENADELFLVAKSEPVEFPEPVLGEVRQERMLGVDEATVFPPCSVDIVVGEKGRLFVVLPTDVKPDIPFACNGPFIQDPARLKIKDPETSPTNRWLLERAGTFAANLMCQWLSAPSTNLAERVAAYDLLPDVDPDDGSLEGTCATIVKEAFERSIEGRAFVLTEEGRLTGAKQSVIVPKPIFEIWTSHEVAAQLDEEGRPAVARQVSAENQAKLLHWGVVDEITKESFLDTLQSKHLPKPETWGQLLELWAYVATEVTSFRYRSSASRLRIAPVQGEEILHGGDEAVRLGDKRLLESDDDWRFLANHLLVLNANWPRFLAEQRRFAEDRQDEQLDQQVEAAYDVLRDVHLNEASGVSKVIDQVASEIFSGESVSTSVCVRFAQIAAKLNARAGEHFRFVSRDNRLRDTDATILGDEDGSLEELLPERWRASHLVHESYWESFNSCTREEWITWISSGRAGLYGFVPMTEVTAPIWGRPRLEEEIRRRGCDDKVWYRYVTHDFCIEDWDFDEIFWQHWRSLSNEDPEVWGRVAKRIFRQPTGFWSHATSAVALHVATTGNTKTVTHHPLTTEWILKLGKLPCLPDTRGSCRKPTDLLRRTPETESLIGVEPFVHSSLDTEATRPLLKVFGVRGTPMGPERLLDCLRALATCDDAPRHEVEKWYRRLDQMMDSCSTDDSQKIVQALRDERLILSQDGGWMSTPGVFLSSDEDDAPGAATVLTSVRDLALWRRIGVADRPTGDLAIQWLKNLPSDMPIPPEDARRVRALVARHPVRVWTECKHWLDLAGRWAPVETLSYALTMQSLVPWRHLHEWIKHQTADLQRLPAEIIGEPPFSALRLLAAHVEERLNRDPRYSQPPDRKVWLNQLGLEFCRIQLDNEAETRRIRELGAALAETSWQTISGLEVIPYVDGTPAGTPRQSEVVWLNRILFAENRPVAKLAKAVAQELGRSFRRPEIVDAIKLCYERPAEFVTEYVEENFTLVAADSLEAISQPGTSPPTTIAAGDAAESSPADSAEHSLSIENVANGSSDDGAIQDHKTDLEVPDRDGGAVGQHSDTASAMTVDQRLPARRSKPRIIERFAISRGFQKDGEDRFYHTDGSWIAKVTDSRFPWERRSATGELLRYYWPKEHCLEREPLQLDADVWGLFEKFPDTYSLVLSDLDGKPVEVRGATLLSLRAKGELSIYPATYRLVRACNRES